MKLLAIVADIYDIDIDALRHSMLPRHVSARRAFIYVTRMKGYSYGEIARLLDMKSKSAVMRLFNQAICNPDPKVSHLL